MHSNSKMYPTILKMDCCYSHKQLYPPSAHMKEEGLIGKDYTYES